MIRKTITAIAFFAALAAPAQNAAAEVVVRFTESAPKDRFEIRNAGQCELGPVEISIDLSGSSAGLIFDTTSTGAGVEVFQPFELVMGADRVKAVSDVSDGFTSVTLNLTGLAPGERVGFTIDVDDTLVTSRTGQTMIDGSEIAGASASLRQDISGDASETPLDADFSPNSVATIPYTTCLS